MGQSILDRSVSVNGAVLSVQIESCSRPFMLSDRQKNAREERAFLTANASRQVQDLSATRTSSSIFLASPKSMRLLSL